MISFMFGLTFVNTLNREKKSEDCELDGDRRMKSQRIYSNQQTFKE